MDHLREQSEITQKEYDMIISNSSVKQQTAQLLDVVLSKGNAPAEVFKNWIQKNDIYLLRDLMGNSKVFFFHFYVDRSFCVLFKIDEHDHDLKQHAKISVL